MSLTPSRPGRSGAPHDESQEQGIGSTAAPARISAALAPAGAEPVRFAGVELGHPAWTEGELAFSEDEAEFAGEDVQPFVAAVGYELRFSGREDLLEDLDPAWVLRQGHHDAASLPAK